MMKILILGSTGQLSQAFQSQCQQLGLKYQVMGRQGVSFPFYLDFLDLSSDWSSLSQYDVIINTVAYTNVALAQKQKDICFQVNAYALRQLIEYAPDALWIHFSTDYVYGHGVEGVLKTEDTPYDPLNIYGESKALGDQLLLDSEVFVWIFRTAGLYDEHRSTGHFQSRIVDQLKKGVPFGVYCDQLSHRTRTAYLARCVLDCLLCTEELLPKGVYHCVEPECKSWYDWAVEIAVRLKLNPKWIMPTTMPVQGELIRPRYGALSMDRLNTRLKLF